MHIHSTMHCLTGYAACCGITLKCRETKMSQNVDDNNCTKMLQNKKILNRISHFILMPLAFSSDFCVITRVLAKIFLCDIFVFVHFHFATFLALQIISIIQNQEYFFTNLYVRRYVVVQCTRAVTKIRFSQNLFFFVAL